LGAIQGITEWLPISSQALVLVTNGIFDPDTSFGNLVYFALTLHLGTCLSSLIYYRSRIFKIFKNAFVLKSKGNHELVFYLITTISSFISALPIFIFIIFVDEISEMVGVIGMMVLGLIYLTGGIFQYFGAKRLNINITENRKLYYEYRDKDISNATNKDGIIIGLIQGFSIIPGMSRSGLTITSLLLRGFNKTESLNISFLLGIPVTLVAGVTGLIYLTEILFIDILAIIISFLIGYLSIKFFITMANKIEFYSFVIFLGLMVLVSSGIYLLIA